MQWLKVFKTKPLHVMFFKNAGRHTHTHTCTHTHTHWHTHNTYRWSIRGRRCLWILGNSGVWTGFALLSKRALFSHSRYIYMYEGCAWSNLFANIKDWKDMAKKDNCPTFFNSIGSNIHPHSWQSAIYNLGKDTNNKQAPIFMAM